MLEKCSNCTGNHIVFSSRCVKKREAIVAAWQSGKIGLPGSVPMSAARGRVTGSNRVVFGPRLQWAAEGGGDKQEMADVDDKEQLAGKRCHDRQD
jgi:hypothetical protein